jgi:GNAT superfamily N-acetyltransferase
MAQGEMVATELGDRGQRAQFTPVREAVTLADGRHVVVRPIRARDAEALQAFFAALSPRSRHRRFHLGVNTLSRTMLRSLTEVDQHHHVALVALADSNVGEGDPTIVAEARYVLLSDCCDAEFAIAVADGWQSVDLGRMLLRRLVEHARRAGNRRLVGDLLADNLPIQALVQKLGGRIVAHPESARLRRAIFDTTDLSVGWTKNLPEQSREPRMGRLGLSLNHQLPFQR